jgi:hypothetical protein
MNEHYNFVFFWLGQRGLYSIDYALNEIPTVSDLTYREHGVVNNAEEVLQHNIDVHKIEVVNGNAALQDAHTVRERREAALFEKIPVSRYADVVTARTNHFVMEVIIKQGFARQMCSGVRDK